MSLQAEHANARRLRGDEPLAGQHAPRPAGMSVARSSVRLVTLSGSAPAAFDSRTHDASPSRGRFRPRMRDDTAATARSRSSSAPCLAAIRAPRRSRTGVPIAASSSGTSVPRSPIFCASARALTRPAGMGPGHAEKLDVAAQPFCLSQPVTQVLDESAAEQFVDRPRELFVVVTLQPD